MTWSFRLSSVSVVARTNDAEAGSDRTAAADSFSCGLFDLHQHGAVELQHLVALGVETFAAQRQHAPSRPRRHRTMLERGAGVPDRLAGIDRLQPFEVPKTRGGPELRPRPRPVPFSVGAGARLDVALHPGGG